MDDLLAAFDAAIDAELPRVSHIEYDSHEICKHFGLSGFPCGLLHCWL